jgi:hypothetical protein
MAFGDNPADGSIRDAWIDFCERAKDAADYVFKDASGSSDGERTNAFRYLTQNLSQAFDIWLENRDTHYPAIHAFCGPTRKLGCDNADCIYHQSWINDHDTYRISGNRGTAKLFNVALQGPWKATLHEPFGDTPLENLLGDDIETDWDGNFEIWISPEPHDRNWLRSTPGVRKIFYRQYFDHWNEVPARFRIERIGGDEAPPPALQPSDLIDAFGRAGVFVVDVVKDWPDTLWEREHTAGIFNELVNYGGPASLEKPETFDIRRGRFITTMNWDIEADQAIIIEFVSPADLFWQITACSVFGASLEYRYRQASLTSGMSPVDADGVTRVILSHADPGFANWVDTQGHTRGWLYWRTMFTPSIPEAASRVVSFADLEKELTEVAYRISPKERAAELRRRRQANMRRFETA